MPTTIVQAFAAAGLNTGAIRLLQWGQKPSTHISGVYVVSLTPSIDSCTGALPNPPLSESNFEEWLNVCPELTLDGVRPTVSLLIDRIRLFWLPDEIILYIGRATSLAKRVGSFYTTPIGAARPHSGGYFLKLLSNLGQLSVRYAACEDPVKAEDRMLEFFCANVSLGSRGVVGDPDHPFPFANLEWPKGVYKKHGLLNSRFTVPRMKQRGAEHDASCARLLPEAVCAFADLLEQHPLRLCNFEQASEQLRLLGISHRLSAKIEGLDQRLQLINANQDAKLSLVLAGDTLPIALRPESGDRSIYGGYVSVPWEFFYFQLSHKGRSETVRIYGSCSGALAEQLQIDPTVPVVDLCDLGTALVRLLLGKDAGTGEAMYSQQNEHIRVARQAATMLRAFATTLG